MRALLESLPPDELTRLIEVGLRVLRIEQAMREAGEDPQTLLTGGVRAAPFRHYPEGDVYDFATHSQFYYHVHRVHEHGHVHAFLRPKGMPADIRPLVPVDGEPDAPCHLVAVGFGTNGRVAELFTTNRWVTGEAWYAADAIARMLPRFALSGGRHHKVAEWMTAILALFRPLIVELALQRDAEVARWAQAHPQRAVLDDSELEVTSRCQVSVETWLADLRHELEK